MVALMVFETSGLLKISTNNSSETVLQCFLQAVSAYGLPSTVRCDKGGENVRVS